MVAKKIVEESVVMLKNEQNLLPLSDGKRAAFFGRAQLNTYFSGNGSGASKTSENLSILEECEKRGLFTEPRLKEFYRDVLSKEKSSEQLEFDFSKVKDNINSGIMYEIFGKYHAPEKEYEIPDMILDSAKTFTDTAVLIIGRNSGGEECDRHLEGDYYLTLLEELLVKQVCESFENVVLILNTNGLIDLAWTEHYKNIRSILFLGICGEQGAAALAEILIGIVNPSGKLPVTIARHYKDYPSSAHFSWDKERVKEILTYEHYGLNAKENGSVGYDISPVTVYWEDIYAGYRYFDTFNIEPLFPFGFGLSYTDFKIYDFKAKKQQDGVKVSARVMNIGAAAGREVVQVYVSSTGMKSERPHQELKGFEKTNLIEPGETAETDILIPWKDLAVYDMERAVYVIEEGIYILRIGNSSRNTQPVVHVYIETDIITQYCRNRLGIQRNNKHKLKFLSQLKSSGIKTGLTWEACADIEVLTLHKEEIADCMKDNIIQDENEEKEVQDFSIEELASLCVGYGPGTPFSAFGDGSAPETIFDSEGKPLTINSHSVGFNGYVSPAMEERGILSVFYKDGPSGIGETAWPSEMLIACAFDRKLWTLFGESVGRECEENQVDIWLAPAVNLHRNPLCGRNFEYISEDPYLTGVCACEITHGVQDNHSVLVCPKHFAVNEQETYRRGSSKKNYDAVDSILTERAARELYLKPFEMLVKETNILCIMSSFNKINGVFAGGNEELCNGILRKEWGFKGVVVTDWGDMDIVVDGADALAAGNDIIMPGGPPVIAQILAGYQEGRVTRGQMENAVRHLLNAIRKRAI